MLIIGNAYKISNVRIGKIDFRFQLRMESQIKRTGYNAPAINQRATLLVNAPPKMKTINMPGKSNTPKIIRKIIIIFSKIDLGIVSFKN